MKDINSDIEPGPANIGIASGVNEESSLAIASSFTFSLIPLCFEKFPVSKAKPELAIIKPPATLKDSILIPKNL